MANAEILDIWSNKKGFDVFPPILTDRQFEILKLIYEGATRIEIAETLQISPETVKAHTKVILKKFSAESVRSGFKQIQNYMIHYGDNRHDNNFLYESVHKKAFINSDESETCYNKQVRLFVVRGEVKEISVLLRSEIAAFYVRINGLPPHREIETGDMREYFYEFVPSIKQGECVEYSNEMRYAEISDLKTRNVVELIRFPTRRFRSEITFARKIPDTLKIREYNSNGTLDLVQDKKVPVEIKGNNVAFELEWPEVGNRYAFVWDWLN
ncbi:helix-turn-helix transcriptional regulator [Rhodobacteraceae bacterium]|nr:helix-turn-helix transcriptional regulator [Paracoccaceae bacterium]